MFFRDARRAALFVLLCIPITASAQTSTKSSSSSFAYRKALALRQQAVALYDHPQRSVDVARLLREEATYRTARDPEAIEALVLSSHFYLYGGRPVDAWRTMEAAAKRALAIGDVRRAAQAYIDAAVVAERWHEEPETKRLALAASLLMESPLLPPEQRDDLMRRMGSALKVGKFD
jgi:hypothetical protein